MLQIQYRKLITLKKLEGNPRTIRDRAFDILCKSIKDNPDYFEARPLILSDRTGELVILAGNQRYEAAKAIGLKEVPTVLLPELTEEREKEIIIRDNINNGEWDMDILANEWDVDLLNNWGLHVPKFDLGHEVNSMTEENLDLTEEFDPIGNSNGLQRVVFIFNGPDEAESYLNHLNVEYKKMNMAWQVNLSTQSI